jgi:hypothetical protein
MILTSIYWFERMPLSPEEDGNACSSVGGRNGASTPIKETFNSMAWRITPVSNVDVVAYYSGSLKMGILNISHRFSLRIIHCRTFLFMQRDITECSDFFPSPAPNSWGIFFTECTCWQRRRLPPPFQSKHAGVQWHVPATGSMPQ